MAAETRYARSGDLHIAYRTLGAGPIDLVLLEQWFSNVEIERDVPPLARFNDRLAAFGRVILFDKRGVGLSDPVSMTAMPPIEEWMDDLRAVMDAVGSERAAVIAGMAGGFMGPCSPPPIRTGRTRSSSSMRSRGSTERRTIPWGRRRTPRPIAWRRSGRNGATAR